MPDEHLFPDLPDPATVAEIVTALPIGERTVRKWIATGQLPAFRLGRKLFVRRDDLEAMAHRVRATV